jgi:hypothetical protein
MEKPHSRGYSKADFADIAAVLIAQLAGEDLTVDEITDRLQAAWKQLYMGHKPTAERSNPMTDFEREHLNRYVTDTNQC